MSVDKDGNRAKEEHGISGVDKVREALSRAFAGGSWADVKKAVDDDMVDVFSISGTPEEVVSRIEELKKAGVTHVVAGSPIGADKARAIKLVGKKVIPVFSEQKT